MANSDNVLRGGLTSKYVDVPELVRILDFASVDSPVVPCVDGEYISPAREFRLFHCLVSEVVPYEIDHDGPTIALCTSGTVRVGHLDLVPGEAVWIPASDPSCQATSVTGGELFIARA